MERISRLHSGAVALATALFATALLTAAPCAQDRPVADAPAPQERTVSAETLTELVATIQDPTRREELVRQLEALLAATRPTDEPRPPSGLERLSAFFGRFTDRLGQTTTRLAEQIAALPDAASALGDRLADPATRGPLVADALRVAATVLGAWLAALILGLLLGRWRRRLAEVQSGRQLRGAVRTARLSMRAALDLVPPAAATAVGFFGLAVLPVSRSGSGLAIAVVSALVIQRVGRAVIEMLLAPGATAIRLRALDDPLADDLARSLRRALAVVVLGYFGLEAIAALGAGEPLLDPLRNVYALVLVAGSVVVIMKYRSRFARGAGAARETAALPGGDAGGAPPGGAAAAPPGGSVGGSVGDDGDEDREERVHWSALGRTLLRLWWVAALLYVVGLYALWLSGIEDGFAIALQASLLTILIVGVTVLALSLLGGAMARLRGQLEGWTAGVPALSTNVARYVALLRNALRVVIVLFALGLVLQAWGIQALNLLSAQSVQAFLSTLLGVLLIVLIALAASDVSTALAQSYLERKKEESTDSAKIRTLVPLANKAIRVTLAVLATMMILGQLGVAIGPMLASVGFLGLAIGFGAQTLVKDLISGVFNLLEDNVSAGDIIKIGETGGVVESINIRTIQLRDLSGNVHTMPWGEVSKLMNLTKEFGRYLIECGVAYREDVDEVMELLRAVGAELERDPEFGPFMLEPLEMLGVDRFEDSAVVIRARLKTVPSKQWSVGREFNRRMKKAFDEHGIEIPFPHRTIYMGQEKDGSAPPLRVLTAAAGAGEAGSTGAAGEVRGPG